MRKIIAALAVTAALGLVGLSNYHHPQANGVSPHPGANGVVVVAVSNF